MAKIEIITKEEQEQKIIDDRVEKKLNEPVTVSSFVAFQVAVQHMVKQLDLTEEQLVEMIDIYSDWSDVLEGTYLESEQYYKYKGKLYQVRVNKGHNKQENWNPEVAHSEFREVLPKDVIPIWVGGKGYDLGAQVTHKGFVWTSKAWGLMSEPGTDGFWEKE